MPERTVSGRSHPPRWRGIYPYLVSPIDESTGEVKRDVLTRLVDHLVAQGVHGLTPLGTTGEVAFLDVQQRLDIVRNVVAAADGRVPVVAGVASTSTRGAIEQATAFAREGVQGLVVMLQALQPLPPDAIERYFVDVAASVEIPVCLYSNPSVLGTDLSVDVIERLSHVPNISYVKDAGGHTGRILSIINRCEGRLDVFSASAHIPALVLQLGGVGWMAGPACVLPSESVALYELAQMGRWPEAMTLQRALWAVNEIFAKHSQAAAIKAALQLQGFDVGDPIPPQPPVGEAGMGEIRSLLDSLTARAAP